MHSPCEYGRERAKPYSVGQRPYSVMHPAAHGLQRGRATLRRPPCPSRRPPGGSESGKSPIPSVALRLCGGIVRILARRPCGGIVRILRSLSELPGDRRWPPEGGSASLVAMGGGVHDGIRAATVPPPEGGWARWNCSPPLRRHRQRGRATLRRASTVPSHPPEGARSRALEFYEAPARAWWGHGGTGSPIPCRGIVREARGIVREAKPPFGGQGRWGHGGGPPEGGSASLTMPPHRIGEPVSPCPHRARAS